MPWTPWITIEADDTASEEASQLYRRTRNPVSGHISDLVRLTSLTPRTSELIHSLSKSVYRSATGLTAREKEIAALVTSSLNGCVH